MKRVVLGWIFIGMVLFVAGIYAGNFFSMPAPVETKLPIVYSTNYDISLDNGTTHVFDIKKFNKVFNHLVQKVGIAANKFYEPKQISDEDLLLVHTYDYLYSLYDLDVIAQILEVYSLVTMSYFDVRNSILIPMRYATGGTVMGAFLALDNNWAINLGGGYHHAKKEKGEGFCFFADIPLAIYKVLEKYPDYKILIVDLDVHQGNGNESILFGEKRVSIFDIYNKNIYPNNKKEFDSGDLLAKKAITFDYPIASGTEDKEYLMLLKNELPKAIQKVKPNLIIYNAGTDIFIDDKLGHLNVTKQGIIARDEFVFQTAWNNDIPILMVLAGGYSEKCAEIISESIENILKHVVGAVE